MASEKKEKAFFAAIRRRRSAGAAALAVAALTALVSGVAAGMTAVPYLDPTDAAHPKKDCTNYTVYDGQTTLTSGWHVVAGTVTNGTLITVSRDVHLILCDGMELNATEGIAVNVMSGGVTNSLTIWAQSDGANAGKLRATGKIDKAGIGGDISIGGVLSGRVTINGGMITAIGGEGGAGIGGGSLCSGGTVTINGGTVKATSTNGGAGIGGGFRGAGGTVTVNGGTVEAMCANGAAAIGNGVFSSDRGSLTLYARAKVTAGDDASSACEVRAADRVTACQKKEEYVKIELCDPHNLDNGSCTWCGALVCEVKAVTAAQTTASGTVEISFAVTHGGLAIDGFALAATDTATVRSWTVYAGDTNLVADAAALLGSNGTHTVTWDMSDALGAGFSATGLVFTVAYLERPAAYCVIDLTAGKSAASYPVTYLDAEPTGGFNTDVYKLTNLVMRLIEPGAFLMGNNASNSARGTALTKPFYMGIFETTQKQWDQVMGGYNPSDHFGFMQPMEYVSWNVIRGISDTYDWPTKTAVGPDSFMGRLRARTGIDFDLPTEAQWEYACRAGTTTGYNNGGDDASDLGRLGLYSDNGGNSNNTKPVGSYQPNAWGLYDMHGNVWEWCLDWYATLSGGTDPVGPSKGTWRVRRGGAFDKQASLCTSYSRNYMYPHLGDGDTGFRLCRTVPDAERTLGSGVSAPVTISTPPPPVAYFDPTDAATPYKVCTNYTAYTARRS